MSGNVGSLLGRPKESKTFAPDPRWVLPKSLIGMEFEYEGATDLTSFYSNDGYLPTAWDVHRDDSLKDNGAEFVFKAPMFGVDAYDAIYKLMTKAQAAKLKCSLRAGIHVHLDARDMETSQLIGLILLYTVLEPILFRWIGDNRENSIFCIPFYKADESLLEACQIVKAIGQDEKHQSKLTYVNAKKFARYAACNLNALYKFGSVEFRHMRTTHNIQRVVDWINIIQSLKAATFKFPTSDGAILRLAKNTATNAFLEYIFGGELARKLWVPDAPELIRNIGIPTARDLVQYGLSEDEWKEVHIPDGKHLGFQKYLDTDLKRHTKKKRSIEDIIQGIEAEPEEAPAAPRPRRAPPPAQPEPPPELFNPDDQLQIDRDMEQERERARRELEELRNQPREWWAPPAPRPRREFIIEGMPVAPLQLPAGEIPPQNIIGQGAAIADNGFIPQGLFVPQGVARIEDVEGVRRYFDRNDVLIGVNVI